MPSYSIRLINSHFQSADEVHYPSLEAARTASISAAIRIAAESVAEGEPTSAVEIQIFGDDELLSRQVVNLSISELTVDE